MTVLPAEAAFLDYERGQQSETADTGAEHGRMPRAQVRAHDEGPDDAGQSERHQRRAHDVQSVRAGRPAGGRWLGGRRVPRGDPRGTQRERHDAREDPAPRSASISHPPASGPSAVEIADPAVHWPMAAPRSSPRNEVSSIARLLGTSSEPPQCPEAAGG